MRDSASQTNTENTLPAESAMPFGETIAKTEIDAEAKGLAIIRKPSASVGPM